MISCKNIFYLVTVYVVSRVAYKYYFVEKKKPEPKPEPEPEKKTVINEALMFSTEFEKSEISPFNSRLITKSMSRLLYYLQCPKYNLDLCMYLITNTDVTESLMALHRRGVQVRILFESEMRDVPGSSALKLARCGINVKFTRTRNYMRHRFCLIDTLSDANGTPLLMAGSMNWTNQALCCSFDNILITSQETLVQPYREEFERLWEMFEGDTYEDEW
ncbi:mitochondrial cardiolipin hydrolase-like [Anticarsia gemmatalis]|uniref:mitochondrial cardiolipin hydrolase-like n=1 Tax=Anticarsia gemmatalis TaxID=129554 RepID=UPI003F774EA8